MYNLISTILFKMNRFSLQGAEREIQDSFCINIRIFFACGAEKEMEHEEDNADCTK
jgi:hypothetical protein